MAATATVAKPATPKAIRSTPVATVADVAVAEVPSIKFVRPQITTVLKPANDALAFPVCRSEKERGSLIEELTQFRFDLVRKEIDSGYSASELHRANNMAWDFMQVDGMTFQDAIKKAAEIVTNTQMAACEAAYVDVMALFERISK